MRSPPPHGVVVVLPLLVASFGACGGGTSHGQPSPDASTPLDGSATTDASAAGDSTGPSDAGAHASDGAAEAEASAPQAPPNKMDILFVVTNDRAAVQEAQTLSLAIPDLMAGLLNPACVDSTGTPVPATAQPGPTGACPAGTTRDFPVISDAHVGVISSSLGSFGGDACPDVTACPDGGSSTSNDDHGHLLSRVDSCSAASVPTYQNLGFLAWDPTMALSPPGVTQLGGGGTPGLVPSLQSLVDGVGYDGCGFSSQNEAWYRFIVDPAPWQTIALNGQTVQTTGVDTTLLDQRQAFLRPDSLLLIVELSPKDDVSIKEFSFYPLIAQFLTTNGAVQYLPHPRSECSTKGPGDPCCASCGRATPEGCPVDPGCASSPTYSASDENLAFNAFGTSCGEESEKALYGVEFFYQPSRYVTALSSATVQDNQGNTVPNPIFAGGKRSPGDVFYAAITGVPWQLIARQKGGSPDLVNGVSDLDTTQVGGFKTFAELSEKDSQGHTFWDDVVGDPEHYVPPLSPFMQESAAARTGTDPITGIAISPATADAGANPINGHEYVVPSPPDDLQYACTYPAQTPIDCTVPGAVCTCPTTTTVPALPLCDPNPNDSMKPTLQTRLGAFPATKTLAIAKGLGAQGIVASTCAAQVSDSSQADYALRPAMKAIVSGVKGALRGP